MKAAPIRYSPLLILAIAWQLISHFELVSSTALPPLSQVGGAWLDLLTSGELLKNAVPSLYRAGVGLLLAMVVGSALGIAMAWWRPVNMVLGPLVEIFYPMPKSALIPVTVIWLGFGSASKILLIFLGCMLPVTIGAFNGARSSEQVLVWSARSMGASRLRMLWDVVVPSALPDLLNGVRTALALAFILMVTSELIVARDGLGNLIGFLGANGSYAAMYAVVLTVALLGFAADRIYRPSWSACSHGGRRGSHERGVGDDEPGPSRTHASRRRPGGCAPVQHRRPADRVGTLRTLRRRHDVHAAAI